MSEPSILLTNDDGTESVGFRAPYDALSELVDMIAVVLAMDQSVVGRKMSTDAIVAEHEFGYALRGTPVDCTVAGLEALCLDVDMAVSGINKGANIGVYVFSRSGIASIVVETAFFDVPAIASLLYVSAGGDLPWYEKATDPRDFREVTNAAPHLVKHVESAGVLEQCGYLNVNAPVPGPDGGSADMQVTVPSELYDIAAEFKNGIMKLHDHVWERMETGDIPNPGNTDRRAVVEGRVSALPLTVPYMTHWHEALDALVETYLE